MLKTFLLLLVESASSQRNVGDLSTSDNIFVSPNDREVQFDQQFTIPAKCKIDNIAQLVKYEVRRIRLDGISLVNPCSSAISIIRGELICEYTNALKGQETSWLRPNWYGGGSRCQRSIYKAEATFDDTGTKLTVSGSIPDHGSVFSIHHQQSKVDVNN